MWKRIIHLNCSGHELIEGDTIIKDSKQSYTNLPQLTLTLPPLSYNWIFSDSNLSSEEAMPPLVRSVDAPGERLTAQMSDEVESKLKCVLVGDGAIGKTSLVVSYTTNGYPTEYVPTAFDNYNVVVSVDNQPIRLQLCDTAGQDDFDSLRSLCYPGCDVFLVCFSVVSPTSFYNVRDKWLPELRLYNPSIPIVLVGTQNDLRTNVKVLIELAHYGEQPVSESVAWKLCHQVGAFGYVESSALTQKNLKEVFDSAIIAALEARSPLSRNSRRYSIKKRLSKAFAQTFSRMDNTIDYSDERHGKSGWRRFCCCS